MIVLNLQESWGQQGETHCLSHWKPGKMIQVKGHNLAEHQGIRRTKNLVSITLPETNIAPENGWFEDEWLVSFRDGWKWQVLCLLVSGRVNAYYGIDFQTNMTAALTF